MDSQGHPSPRRQSDPVNVSGGRTPSGLQDWLWSSLWLC
jgi:hypothetical protein